MSLHPSLVRGSFALIEGFHLLGLLYVVTLILVVDKLWHIPAKPVRLWLFRIWPEIVRRYAKPTLLVCCITHHLIFKLLESLILRLILDISLIISVSSITTFLDLFNYSKLTIVKWPLTLLRIKVLMIAWGLVAISLRTLVRVDMSQLVRKVLVTLSRSLLFFHLLYDRVKWIDISYFFFT